MVSFIALIVNWLLLDILQKKSLLFYNAVNWLYKFNFSMLWNSLLGDLTCKIVREVTYREGKCIYIVHVLWYLTLKALRHRSHSFTCNYASAYLYPVSVHQT